MNLIRFPILTLCCGLLMGQSRVPENPESIPTTGRYRNFNYGFTTVIPKGLQGWWDSIPMVFDEGTQAWVSMSDHGRRIPIGPNAEILIRAEHNAIEDTPPRALYGDIKSFQGGVDNVDFQIERIEPFRFQNYKAMRYLAHKEIQSQTIWREAVVAFTKDLSIEYVISIEGPEGTFRQQHHHFSSILRAWHPSPRK